MPSLYYIFPFFTDENIETMSDNAVISLMGQAMETHKKVRVSNISNLFYVLFARLTHKIAHLVL